ncbi:MAG: hypothetical protein HY420_04785 [Candidatus Kerfeldbacteria bacterium]|nr:hypothetical protein [Candidatus Kerfeldbacteria bacterium]
MTRSSVETITEVTTAHKISVGLLTATATLVLISTVIAALYTLSLNARSGAGVVVNTPTERTSAPLEPVQPVPGKDRVLELK